MTPAIPHFPSVSSADETVEPGRFALARRLAAAAPEPAGGLRRRRADPCRARLHRRALAQPLRLRGHRPRSHLRCRRGRATGWAPTNSATICSCACSTAAASPSRWALCATVVALTIGVVYGAVAGFVGGMLDAAMMRIVDILYALPFTLFVILLMVFFGRNIILLFVAIGAVEWLTMARIVRGQVMAVKRMEFVEAARAAGLRTQTDPLPPHPAQRPRADHRLYDADGSLRHADRGLPQFPRPRRAAADELLGRADQGRRREDGGVPLAARSSRAPSSRSRCSR